MAKLIARFGFSSKNVVAPLALLPIAMFLKRRGNRAFDTSSEADEAAAQIAIRQWFIFATLKGAFGGSSDTTLARLRDVLNGLPHERLALTGGIMAAIVEPTPAVYPARNGSAGGPAPHLIHQALRSCNQVQAGWVSGTRSGG